MLIHHPDKTNDKILINRGMEIIQAYNILSDTSLRKQYDLKLQNFIKQMNNKTVKHYNVV